MSVYLVTGGAGFIGSHLVTHLINQGHTVRVVDNFSTGQESNLAHLDNKIELFRIDIRNKIALEQALQGVEFVFHLAALASVPQSVEYPEESYAVNVTGTLNVLLAARDAGVKRVLFVSSSAAYGDSEAVFKREDMPTSVKSPYAASKVAGENYCMAFNDVYDIETVVVRYFNVFGPRQDPNSAYAAVIPLFATALANGESPKIYGTGEQTRDFTYIDTVIEGTMLAMHNEQSTGEIFNIACGQQISILDLLREINEILGTSVEPVFMPIRVGDILHSCANIEKAERLLKFNPTVSYSEGLRRTLDYYVHHKNQ